MQGTQLGTPVIALGVGQRPSFDFFEQSQALRAVLCRVFFHLLEPDQNRFVGFIASGIKALPQGVIGQATLVNLLPAFAQLAQLVLHLSAPHGRGFFGVEQGFGLVHQVLTNLIGQPALPPFSIACGDERFVHALVKAGFEIFAVGLEHGAQGNRRIGRHGRFGDLLFKRFEHFGHRLAGLLAQRLALSCIQFGFGGFDFFGDLCGPCCSQSAWHFCQHFATQTANFISPNRHRWQGCRRITLGCQCQHQCSRKTIPDRLQLIQCGVQLTRKLHVHTRPHGVGGQLLRLRLPLGHIRLQACERSLRFGDGFGGQHFNALRQQHGSFTLHHHLVLQIFDTLDHFGQAEFQTGQGLARQRRTGLGRISLPSHGVGNVQTWGLQHLLGFLGPVAGHGFLIVHAFELVQLFLQLLGRAFVS